MTVAPSLLPRRRWLTLLRTGLSVGAWDFVRQAADAYLQHIPNDLSVRLLQAEALLGLGARTEAYRMAAEVALADPENPAAHDLCWRALPAEADARRRAAILGALAALEALPRQQVAPDWGATVRHARVALRTGHAEAAQELLLPVLPGQGDLPLLAVMHLRVVWALGDWAATLHLARTYHRRWPHTLAIGLILAHHLAESGQEAESVALLHAIAVADPAAEVARRVFGEDFPYRALWAPVLAAPLEMPLPAAVAAALGKNGLPMPPRASRVAVPHGEAKEAPAPSPLAGQKRREGEEARVEGAAAVERKHPASRRDPAAGGGRGGAAEEGGEQPVGAVPPAKGMPQGTQDVRVPVASSSPRRAPTVMRTEGRFPVYVILSTRRGLTARYGRETAAVLIEHMEALAAAVTRPQAWDALVLLADDAASARAHGVKPVPPGDPWAIKKQLAALDAALKRKGSMIGALLIVGGDEVVPFHRLPNPLEDDDDDVPSDNPYGSPDENYFAPVWPVGRLPGSADGDPALLLAALRRLTAEHRTRRPHLPWHRRWWAWLQARLPWGARRNARSLGYTAAVWERTARAVFRTIGSPKSLLSSPPVYADALGPLPRARTAYFNLHGLADAAAWYGQRPPTAPSDAPDYPVALRPEDIPTSSRAARVVFSEACYGAYVHRKTPKTAIALRFLYAGTHAFVGSTVTAYGTVTPPLSGADLLARYFWQRLKRGVPAGEALRQAKYLYARQTHERFGFLDGEDQKTLISFVLYGDPLYRLEDAPMLWGKSVLRPSDSLALQAAEERAVAESAAIPPRMSKQVQRLVATYLPGNGGLAMLLAEEHLASQAKKHGSDGRQVARKIVVVSKQVPRGEITHRHFMRVSMDRRGKVLKVTMSR